MIAALLLASAVAAAPPAPTYLVERVIVAGGQTRRVSVFRDGMAALVRRTGGGHARVSRRRLDPTTLEVVRQVVDAAYGELAGAAGLESPPGDDTVELRAAPPGRPALTVRLPLGGVTGPEVLRLGIALDDVESSLADLPPGAEDLSRWVPRPGERVLLLDGSVVLVEAVHDDGEKVVVRVSIGDGVATVFYELEELRRRAVRLVAP